MKRILIVDGDHTYRRMLGETLESRGHEVHIIGTAREAFQLAPASFDVAVVEYRLSDATGLSLLWKWGSLATITPIILVSNHLRPIVVDEARRSGVFEFLEKHEDAYSVLEAVDRAGNVETTLLESF